MATRKLFRRIFYKLAPSWLTTEDGEKVLFSLGLMMDAFAERARQGALANMPSYCPEDALAPIGRERRIIRGINESAETYAERLLPWLDDHAVRGNAWKMMDQLRGYCGVDMMIRTVDVRGNWYTRAANGSLSYLLDQANWNWDGAAASQWSRFWVVIYPSASLWTVGPTWGAAALWGGAWGTAGYTWGSTATPDDVQSIRSIVREWKPAGTRCVNIILAFDAASFAPTGAPGAPLPDGAWGKAAKASGGAYVASRLSTARYWSTS